MLLPIRTSIRPQRVPYANYVLIAINIIVFLFTYGPHHHYEAGQLVIVPVREWVKPYMLTPEGWQWWQFITYAFLHGNPWHIIGNMFFLYLFGNNVNDRIGHVRYVLFYLAGAVFAGIGHAFLHTNPVLGASGAVAAVTGCYLVLFPHTLITVVYWFFFIGTIEVPALYFIAFKLIIWDNVVEPKLAPSAIAYSAHLAGYVFGILAMLIMLITGLTSSSSLDLWAMIKQWNRRRQYRDVVSNGYDPFTGQSTTKEIKVKEVNKTAVDKQQGEKIKELRNEIGMRMLEHNLPAAAELYMELMSIDSEQILPRQYLLDIANQLASDKKASESARAYEQFLSHYSNFEYAEQVELMLGILYSRYLNEHESAVKHLQAAAQKLSDPDQLKMCQDELARLQE